MFGTDGMRSIYGDRLINEEYFFYVGVAIASLAITYIDSFQGESLKNKPIPLKIIIGGDTRVSSKSLINALKSGIENHSQYTQNNSLDTTVYEVIIIDEPISTSIISFLLTHHEDIACGLMVTASHNFGEYNGVKIFDNNGLKIDQNAEVQITNAVSQYLNNSKCKTISLFSKNNRCLENNSAGTSLLNEYINCMKQVFRSNNDSQNVDGEKKMRILIDCANGGLSLIAQQIYKCFDEYDFVFVNAESDGMQINRNAGILNEQLLIKSVHNSKSDYGFAFDGDGDRVIASVGNYILDGDEILALLSTHYEVVSKYSSIYRNYTIELNQTNAHLNEKADQHISSAKMLVSTVMSNSGLAAYLNIYDIPVIECSVGDKNVVSAMLKHDACLGGEKSGHIITKINRFCGDGIVVSLLILKILHECEVSFPLFIRVPQTHVNVPLSDIYNSQCVTAENFINLMKSALNNICTKVVIRQSGTEPLVRVSCESHDISGCKSAIRNLFAAWNIKEPD
jgi:phosphoglucosamine mutase